MAIVTEVSAAPRVVAWRTSRPRSEMAVSRSSRVRRSVTSLALRTMPSTAGSSSRLVARPSSHTHCPDRRRTRKEISVAAPGLWVDSTMARRSCSTSSLWISSPLSTPSSSWGS